MLLVIDNFSVFIGEYDMNVLFAGTLYLELIFSYSIRNLLIIFGHISQQIKGLCNLRYRILLKLFLLPV